MGKRRLEWDDELILLVPYNDAEGVSWGDEGISVRITIKTLLTQLIRNHSVEREVETLKDIGDIEWDGDVPYPSSALAWMGDI